MKTYQEMVELFERANQTFINTNQQLFYNNFSERRLCGALMLCLHELIAYNDNFYGYFVDVEYNRNKGALKTICKTIRGNNQKIIRINCDLILHSRGEHPEQDNLVALEMKKSSARKQDKQNDCDRLIALTKDTFDDVWPYDGNSLPEHVCRYVLGVYYEINYRKRDILIEYYRRGNHVATHYVQLS